MRDRRQKGHILNVMEDVGREIMRTGRRPSMMPIRKMRPSIGWERAVVGRSGANIGTCQKIIPVGIRRTKGVKADWNDGFRM